MALTQGKPKRSNRSRMRPKKTTGIVLPTEQAVRGFAEPLSRYVDLPSGILGQLYNVINGKPASSRYYLESLTNLIHEAEEYTSSRKLLYRPPYQNRHGINHEAIYRKSLGSALQLVKHRLRDLTSIQWINNTHLMKVDKDTIEPDIHDQEVVIIGASIEILARRHRGFYSHIDILKKASPQAQQAESPLSVPIEKVEFKFPSGRKEEVRNTHFKSDNLLALPAANGGVFVFWHEHDRHTEIMEPTKGLKGISWLKKILMTNAMASGSPRLFETYFGIPNLRILATFHGYVRQQTFNRLVRQYARYPTMFASAVIPPVDLIENPRIVPELYNEPVWMRHDGSMFSLREEVQ